ncbi:MAG: hypothetical protein JNL69_13050 [Bacteroidia bacterium]|nr:hypothetical protein [Bacteroidia bacterium]
MKLIVYLSCLILLVFAVSCGGNTLDVDVSEVQLPPVKIKRLDKDIFEINTSNIEAETKKLQEKYGDFYSLYITRIVNNGGIADSSYEFQIKQFIADKDMLEAFNDCKKVDAQIPEMEQSFTLAFKRFKYHFSDKHTPNLIYMMTGFNYPSMVVDSTLAIGLEMYLGTDNKFYHMLSIPRYKSMFMNTHNILPDGIRVWMMNEFPYNMNKSDFLSEIIYIGKVMYLTDALLPDVSDTLKIQYTNAQMDYCTQNEYNVWSYFVAQKILYTTNQADIMKYTADGPFTSALSKESAPRIGYWLGWQIVRQFMKNNPETTLEQLMAMEDAQLILTQSKYKPKK